MKYLTVFACLLLLTSCFRFNGRITIQNDRASNLKIETTPIIHSGSGGWENGIQYYNEDSIMWIVSLGNRIKAKIIQPNHWRGKDSTFLPEREGGYHFGDYSAYRYDTTMNGIYSMYPNSSFTIGEFTTRKKIIPSRGTPGGRFTIRKLTVHTGGDTLVANGDKEIWELLLRLDKNKDNYEHNGKRKRIRHWTVSIVD